jgi:hypothetical protein
MPQLHMHFKKIWYAVALLLIVFCGSLHSIKHKRQLGLMGGMAEEYLALSLNCTTAEGFICLKLPMFLLYSGRLATSSIWISF